MADRWNVTTAPAPPRSRIAAPDPLAVVDARDHTDRLLTPPGSLGVLDTALDRVIACCGTEITQATLVLAAGDHPVADLGVTPYRRSVTAEVYAAAVAGQSIGISAANAAGVGWTVVDAGSSSGDLVTADGMARERTTELIDEGVELGQRLAGQGLVVLGEVGVGNTTVAAALASALLGLAAQDVVGLGSGADSPMRDRKVAVVGAAVARWRRDGGGTGDLVGLLSALGGPEFALMCGVTLGASSAGGAVVLDGFATGVAAACACAIEPGVRAHLIAGQRSSESAHGVVLGHLGLEPLLDLRFRAGEGVGAVMATRLLLDGLRIRRTTARTTQSVGPR